jgi:hypothetical protein
MVVALARVGIKCALWTARILTPEAPSIRCLMLQQRLLLQGAAGRCLLLCNVRACCLQALPLRSGKKHANGADAPSGCHPIDTGQGDERNTSCKLNMPPTSAKQASTTMRCTCHPVLHNAHYPVFGKVCKVEDIQNRSIS